MRTLYLTPQKLHDVTTQVNFFEENLKVFKKVFLPLFTLVIISSNVDQYLNTSIEQALSDPSGAQQQVYFFGFLSLLSGIAFPMILATITLFSLNSLASANLRMNQFLTKNLNQICIETLRSWGKTILWSLLFILPGIFKYIEYIFVPFVVTSSSVYEAGSEDALKKSAQIVRKNWLKVLFVLGIFHIFIPLFTTTLFDSYRLIWKTPLASLSLSLFDTYILIFSTHILFKIYNSEVSSHDQSNV